MDAYIEPATHNPWEFFKDPAGWLYSDWDEQKYDAFLQLYAFHPVRLYIDYLFDKRSASEYLYNNGMDYNDIHDPRRLPGTASSTALNGYVLGSVSSNINKLYR